MLTLVFLAASRPVDGQEAIPWRVGPGFSIRSLLTGPRGEAPVAHAIDARGRLVWVDGAGRLLGAGDPARVIVPHLDAPSAVLPVAHGWLVAERRGLRLHEDRDGDGRGDGPAREIALPGRETGRIRSLVSLADGGIAGSWEPAAGTLPRDGTTRRAVWRARLDVAAALVWTPIVEPGQGLAALASGDLLTGCAGASPLLVLGGCGGVSLGGEAAATLLDGWPGGGVAVLAQGDSTRVLQIDSTRRRLDAACLVASGASYRLAAAVEALATGEPYARLGQLTPGPTGSASLVLRTREAFHVLVVEGPGPGPCPPASGGELAALRRRVELWLRDPGAADRAELARLCGERWALADPAIVRLLAHLAGPGEAQALFGEWKRIPASARDESLLALARRPAGAAALLRALERGDLLRRDVPAAAALLIAALEDPALTRSLEQHWGIVSGASNVEISSLLARVAAALDGGRGNAARGARLFDEHCGRCHRLGGRGQEVGPGLQPALAGDPRALARAIVHPNERVPRDYMALGVLLGSGELLQGLPVTIGEASVTLRREQGLVETIERSRIRRLVPSTLSLMPEGLLAGMSDEQVRDLFAHLTAPARPLAARVAGPLPAGPGAARGEDESTVGELPPLPGDGVWRPLAVDGWGELRPFGDAAPPAQQNRVFVEIAWAAGASADLAMVEVVGGYLAGASAGDPERGAGRLASWQATEVRLQFELPTSGGRLVICLVAAAGDPVRLRLRTWTRGG